MRTIEYKKFIYEIPKTDLHLHLDGSLRLSTLIELAKKENIKLPSYTAEGLKELVFKEKYEDLVDYLKGFAYTCAVLRNKENLERVAYELAEDNIKENVRYIEVRFAPQLHINKNLESYKDVIEAINNGLERAAKEHNNSNDVRNNKDIPFRYGIIAGAMRHFNEFFSPYYNKLISSLPNTPMEDIFKIASMDLARGIVLLKNNYNLPIVSFDLCGGEAGYPAILHKEAYEYVHKHFLGKTVHAGEAYGPESIFQAITKCHANRIGHGTSLFSYDKITDPDVINPKKYTEELAEYIARRRITIEVCITSNLQTLSHIKTVKEHPVKKMIDKKISVSICTDNRLVSNTTPYNELVKLVENFDITPKQFRDIIIAGFKGAFYNIPYTEHRIFVRQAINKYDEISRKYFQKGGGF